MRFTRFVAACVAAVLFGSTAAIAVPVGAGVLLGFGDRYSLRAGETSLHRGVDVACQPGDAVFSPLAGEISFVGRVPATAGGTMLAVSVITEAGTITLMPFSEAHVKRGQSISAGERIGTAAGFGDASSAEPHLHVGLKRGSLYLDPSELLVAPPVPEADRSPEPGVAVIVESPAPSPAGQGVAVVPAQGALQPAGAGVAVLQPGVAVVRSGVAVVHPGVVTAPAPGGSIAGVAPDTVSGAVDAGVRVLSPIGAEAPGRPVVTASPLRRLGDAAAERILSANKVSPAGVAAILVALVACALLFSVRTLQRRVLSSTVSDRLGYLLQHLKAGDTLRGLTSCPGPLPSQSRGRIAQGR